MEVIGIDFRSSAWWQAPLLLIPSCPYVLSAGVSSVHHCTWFIGQTIGSLMMAAQLPPLAITSSDDTAMTL